MRTLVVQQANPPCGIAKGDQAFTQQPYAQRRPVRFGEFMGVKQGKPIGPQ